MICYNQLRESSKKLIHEKSFSKFVSACNKLIHRAFKKLHSNTHSSIFKQKETLTAKNKMIQNLYKKYELRQSNSTKNSYEILKAHNSEFSKKLKVVNKIFSSNTRLCKSALDFLKRFHKE